ncbi:unnamed protein product [Rhizophagus irregularis]|uniref:Uncharacterized protein n=1 Tax=Rhizophagus irregularis TaxID=588596 RepID=A0A915ZY76_9GLOM|nr:unnamed protein product [Rhizophagus irregularis]
MEDLNLPESTFDLTELLDKDLLISENETYDEYEDLEENKDLEENLMDENEIFYSENEIDNNNKSLFELDFNAFANAKKFVQQDISDEENNFGDIEIDFSETESDEECDEIINKIENDENLSPCVIIDMYNGGHIYQRVGKGVQKDPNCDNKSHYQNDTKEALEAIRYWILDVTTSEKLIWQEKILAALVPVLSIQSLITIHLIS